MGSTSGRLDDLTPEERCGALSKVTALKERGYALARSAADESSLIRWRDECIGVLNEAFGNPNAHATAFEALDFTGRATPPWQRIAVQRKVKIRS